MVDGQLAAFYERDRARLVAGLSGKLRDPDLAAECVDEAMTRAWIRIADGDTIDNLGAWVRTVAMNAARDRLRRRATEERHAQRARVMAVAASPVERVDGGIDFERALAGLPRRQREIATLRYVQDLSCDEIAAEVGRSSGYVRSALARSRKTLIAAIAVVTVMAVALIARPGAQTEPVKVDITPATQPVPTTAGPDEAADANKVEAGPVITDDDTTGDDTATPSGAPKAAAPETRGPTTTTATTATTPTTGAPAVEQLGATTAPADAETGTTPAAANETDATTPPPTATPAPEGEPTPDTVTVTCCDWGLGMPYREIHHGEGALLWSTIPGATVTLRLYSPPTSTKTSSVHIAAASVSPTPPSNSTGVWTVTIAPGEAVTLRVTNLQALQIPDCWVQGCRLVFVSE
jgi:RNA polymerase sigma-70 factor (ECF subfamily)